MHFNVFPGDTAAALRTTPGKSHVKHLIIMSTYTVLKVLGMSSFLIFLTML